ncbi:MAG: hypothetical protein RIQ53_2908 [Pseudomonadota bacterium]
MSGLRRPPRRVAPGLLAACGAIALALTAVPRPAGAQTRGAVQVPAQGRDPVREAAREPQPAGDAGPALSPAQVYARVAPSVWRVQSLDAQGLPLGQGSGVVIARGRVVTNCHVLAHARRVQLRRDGPEPGIAARLEAWDPPRDLCLLDAPGIADAPAVERVPTTGVVVGQTAYAIGHPKGLDLTMSAGLVSSLRRNTAGQLVLVQTSAAISGGNSGGGLFDERGRLIGLTTMVLVAADAQNLNFAIPADWIGELPRRHAQRQAAAPSVPVPPTTPTPAPAR